MQERVNLLGGTFSMLSRPGAGTTITATLPIASTRGAS
jgi:signal transduction histidine kinase